MRFPVPHVQISLRERHVFEILLFFIVLFLIGYAGHWLGVWAFIGQVGHRCFTFVDSLVCHVFNICFREIVTAPLR